MCVCALTTVSQPLKNTHSPFICINLKSANWIITTSRQNKLRIYCSFFTILGIKMVTEWQ